MAQERAGPRRPRLAVGGVTVTGNAVVHLFSGLLDLRFCPRLMAPPVPMRSNHDPTVLHYTERQGNRGALTDSTKGGK